MRGRTLYHSLPIVFSLSCAYPLVQVTMLWDVFAGVTIFYTPDSRRGTYSMASLGLRHPVRYAIILAILLTIFLSALYTAPTSSNAKKSRSPKLHFRPKRSPTRYHGSVPIVDRAKLAEIEARMLYTITTWDDDPDFEVWDAPPNPNSPPKVTEVPRIARKRKPKILPHPSE